MTRLLTATLISAAAIGCGDSQKSGKPLQRTSSPPPPDAVVVASAPASPPSPIAELASRLETAERDIASSLGRAGSKGEPIERILQQIIRYGGPEAEELLSQTLPKHFADSDSLAPPPGCDLAVLAALRRVQHQPDPLIVEVIPAEGLKVDTRSLPTLDVLLKSADVDRIPLRLKIGGDYRSGREARWRIEVSDATGAILPVRRPSSGIGGGIYSFTEFKYGESQPAELPMSSYVDIPKPGKYMVTVAYHNSETIADIANPSALSDLIVFRSEPFALTVEQGARQIIQLETGARQKVKRLIGLLPDEGVIKMVGRKYNPSFHQFIDPTSPAGQLLQMDLQAIPGLLDALNDTRLSGHRKAWVLAFLYTITWERDLNPIRLPGVLPEYYSYISADSCQWADGGRIDAKEQQRLIEKWMEFQKMYLDIREARPAASPDK